MDGVLVSQAEADKLKERGLEVYINPSEGIMVRIDDVPQDVLQRLEVYKTGARTRTIPENSYPW